MHPELMHMAQQAHRDDLRREAAQQRRVRHWLRGLREARKVESKTPVVAPEVVPVRVVVPGVTLPTQRLAPETLSGLPEVAPAD